VTLVWEQIVIPALDPRSLGKWWCDALGWVVTIDTDEEFEIRPVPTSTPGMVFIPTDKQKTGQNRIHPDFRPDDQQAEVERLLRLGARRADIGQGDQPWIVLLDVEGNEFCVLGNRKP